MRAKYPAGAAAFAMLLAGHAAFAVTLNPRGIGEVLIYPYFTVNKSQDTLVSVANASDVGKAVQVRILEGYNGRQVLGFVLFLSAHDVWTASISQTADDGGAKITTGDSSCTFPAFAPGIAVPFQSAGYDGSGVVPADGGPQTIARTREGSIEFLVGGDIVAGSATDTAITHVQNGTPGAGRPSCSGLSATSFFGDMNAPTSGIYGAASIIDVGIGTFFAYNADALQGFSDVALFSASSALGPTLEDANSAESPDNGAIAYISNARGRPLALDYAFGIDAVSAVFMANTVYNEYLADASLGANTDWVVTLPTKRFYVDAFYGAVPIAPFTGAFHSPGAAEVGITATVNDREEGSTQYPFCSFGLCDPLAHLDYEVNVLSFGNAMLGATVAAGTPSPMFGSTLTPFQIRAYGSDGAVVMDLANSDGGHVLPGGIDADGAGVSLNGLPIAGFMAYNVINTNAEPGLLANYSGVFTHRTTMSCSGPASECAQVIVSADQ